jgi:hypothetical protein
MIASGRSCSGALSNEIGHGRDEGSVGRPETAAEAGPEADAELVAGLDQSEESVAAVAPGIGARAG